MSQGLIRHYMAHAKGTRFSPLWALLTPASVLHRWLVRLRNFLYQHGLCRVTESPLPLVSVGNLTYGGTNKTPFVEMLVRSMRARGVKVGIVSRGYGGRGKADSVLVVQGAGGNRESAGDEPLLLARRLGDVPVAVARRRIEGIQALRERGAELVIADDAFQHRSLGRDLDVVLIDASCPFGNGRLIPAGILREPPDALRRAHLAVLTKADQTTPEALEALRRSAERHLPPERIFTSRLSVESWGLWDGTCLVPCPAPEPGTRILAFSAIGNPESFTRSLGSEGLEVAGALPFKDHHRYRPQDLTELERARSEEGAAALACTEKDLYNLPAEWRPSCPLFVPRVTAVLDEPERFFRSLTDLLRPRLIVASNGYGEDAIGVLLARRLKDRFPGAEVLAFPLVGRGDAYLEAGFPVRSAPSVTPSGGVVKYRLRDLWGDMRAGLLSHVRAQLADWRGLAGTVRTPLCVGDVYLLLHTLWGSGARPLFVATAKTVHLSGHWRLERALIRRLALRTWTRDPESALQLRRSRADAVYSGSPIMDLLGDGPAAEPPSPPAASEVPGVLLLPGSRLRAYEDVNLLLDAALALAASRPCRFRMVLAPTLSRERLLASCRGWKADSGGLTHASGLGIALTTAPVSEAARGMTLLLGLGGTANQLCAGLGIPVVSIDEKGKRVQKKLLGEAEILVPPAPEALASCALEVLSSPSLYRSMSSAGQARMGRPGALAALVDFAARELGWDARLALWKKLL